MKNTFNVLFEAFPKLTKRGCFPDFKSQTYIWEPYNINCILIGNYET